MTSQAPAPPNRPDFVKSALELSKPDLADAAFRWKTRARSLHIRSKVLEKAMLGRLADEFGSYLDDVPPGIREGLALFVRKVRDDSPDAIQTATLVLEGLMASPRALTEGQQRLVGALHLFSRLIHPESEPTTVKDADEVQRLDPDYAHAEEVQQRHLAAEAYSSWCMFCLLARDLREMLLKRSEPLGKAYSLVELLEGAPTDISLENILERMDEMDEFARALDRTMGNACRHLPSDPTGAIPHTLGHLQGRREAWLQTSRTIRRDLAAGPY